LKRTGAKIKGNRLEIPKKVLGGYVKVDFFFIYFLALLQKGPKGLKNSFSYSSFALTQKKQKVKDSAIAPRACPGQRHCNTPRL
jgi:hypothetical protein